MLITVVEPSFEILAMPSNALELLERAGRTCYKSEDRITEESAKRFVKMLRDSGHESVLEHASATVKIICSRSCSHQLVRHRIASFSQESQRYVNYNKKGFQVICPSKIGIPAGEYYFNGFCPIDKVRFYTDASLQTKEIPLVGLQGIWLKNRIENYWEYLFWLDRGIPPEDARECLPNATKTEVVTTMNLRMWRHVFQERALNPKAQWQIREIMLGILKEFQTRIPVVFDDLS